MPSLSFLNRAKDIFDANTEEDQRKRLQRGGKRLYKEDEEAKGRKRVADNIGQQFVGNTLRFLNTAKVAGEGAGELGGIAKESIFGTDESYRKRVGEAEERLKKSTKSDSGLFRAGTIVDDFEQGVNLSPTELTKKTVGTGLGVASEVLPAGKGAKGLSLAQKAGRGFIRGGLEGAGGNVGSQLVLEGDVDLGEAAKATAFGGVLGGATPIAGAGLRKGAAATTKAVRKLDEAAFTPGTVRVTPEDIRTISDYQEHLLKKPIGGAKVANETIKKARDLGDRWGIDVTSGTTRDINDRINTFLDEAANQRTAISQGGYIGPGRTPKEPEIAAVSTPTIPTTAPISDIATPPATSRTAAQQIIEELQGKKAEAGISPVKGAKAIRATQEAGYSAERGKRIKASAAAGKELEGSAGYYAELKKLKGELPKEEYRGLGSKLDPGQQEELFTQLRKEIHANPAINGFDAVNAQTALRKVINGGNGVPTRGEIKLLEKAFGADFAKSIEDDVIAHQQGLGKAAISTAAQIAGVPRAIMASADFSGGLRQGLAAATRHPVIFAQEFVKQFKYFGSEKAYREMQDELASHPNYGLMQRGKLAITDVTGTTVGNREEQFASNLAERIPVLGRLIKASDRAYTGLLTSMRANIFNQLVDNAQRAGIDFSEEGSQKLLRDMAEVVNTSTGRGSLGKLESSAEGLSTALFAPRLIASRLQMLNPQYYVKLDPIARKEAITTLMSLAAVTGTVLTAAKMAGAEVSTEPTSSDFGKIKIGDTRLDIMGGYQQYVRLGAQLIEGKITSSLTGTETTLDGGFGKPDRLEIINRFLQNKESPVLSFVTTLLRGKDASGNPVKVKNEVISRFVPLVAQDVTDLFTHEEAASPALAPLAAFGVGLQTYGVQDVPLSESQRGIVENVRSTGTPEQTKAYESFYKTSKLVTGRRPKVSEQVNEAIGSGDLEKAQKIAREYNEEVKKSFKKWGEKYNDIATPELVQEYNGLKINLNRNTISQRRYNIRRKAKQGIIPR